MTIGTISPLDLPGKQQPWDVSELPLPPSNVLVAVGPSPERVAQVHKHAFDFMPDEPHVRPPTWTPEWKKALVDGIARILASSQLPGAWVPALDVPRFVHGQSQGICDIFGTSVEEQQDGNFFVRPLGDDPKIVDQVRPLPIEKSTYWGAVEWICYARDTTKKGFHFRNPVMCGPFDLANYLLGTTRLMEWVYTEPATVHRLLDKTTDVVIDVFRALKNAAGGTLHAHNFGCMANAFDMCSECRSLVSAEVFETFIAPYLQRVGQALGPYGIHSCGSWERTIPRSLQDPNLKGMNGQVRENDLQEICSLAGAQVFLSIDPSVDLDKRYTWPDRTSFLKYILETASDQQSIEIRIDESEIGLYTELHHSIRGRNDTPNKSIQATK